MSDVVISGYYGFRNNGDDALLMSIINDLKAKKPDIDIVVLSKNPAETKKIYNVRAVSRQNVLKLLKELRNTKMLISGGGTLIQDGTSTKSLLYYLSIIKAASMLGKKVMLYANGIGPLKSEANRKRTKNVLDKVDVITLRDETSFVELKEIGVKAPKIEITADPAFRLEFDYDAKDTEKPEKTMLVSVRPWKELASDFCDVIAKVCDYANSEYGLKVAFLPMQQKYDREITEKIRSLMKSESVVIGADYDIKRLLSLFSDMSLCVGMRLHTLIYSAVSCVPLVGLVYDPKVSGFLDYIGNDNYIDAREVSFNQLKEAIDLGMSNCEEQKSVLLNKREELRKKAERNAELAIDLLLGGESK
ncbi:MAG: polysaccharide pyruvyl transferase CsaB [Clostridia bacterium]|nr:polysaccharide pyruvyl transferase CsaB [Clostridia bacterium]